MNNIDSYQLFSASCAPCSSDNSIFFNLILGTNYEDTKENCVIFLKNYSNHFFYTKREIFKLLINELTLNQNSNTINNNNESIYLIRQLIKKYSRNNILNALYEFVCEKDVEVFPLINNKKNDDNGQYISNEDDSSYNEKEEINNKKSIIKKNNLFLAKKRKILYPSKIDKIINKSNKRSIGIQTKKSKNQNRIINKENNEENNIKKEKEKQQFQIKRIYNEEIKEEEKKKDEGKMQKYNEDNNNKINDINADIDKNIIKEENQDFDTKNEEKEESYEINIESDKKEEEKNIKKENKEIENNKEKKEFKIENVEKGEKKENQYQNKDINRTKIILINKSKSYASIMSKSVDKQNNAKINQKRFFSAEEIIKLDSSNELNNSMSICSINSIHSKNMKNQIVFDKIPYSNIPKQQINYVQSKSKNEFSSHLIKNQNQNNFIYSYKLINIGEEKNKIIYFECNNRKCKGKGEYDIDNKIFTETEQHNLSTNSHKLASTYYNAKISLLNDTESIGYQLLKNKTYIKDKKVVMIK